MAVLIASDLAKDVAGEPLLRGVSFKLERRERLTLSGRNGSGKTTLLRMLAGRDVDRRRRARPRRRARGVALHDQRPPRERDLILRDYVLSGCADLVALEEELARLEQAMARGAHRRRRRSTPTRARRRGSSTPAATLARRAIDVVRGLGFADGDLDRRLSTPSPAAS